MGSSGIYKLSHKPSGEFYVGQARNFAKREARHRQEMAVGKHDNALLQAKFTPWNEEDFEFEILEACGIALLNRREQAWMRRLNPSLNEKMRGTLRGTRISFNLSGDASRLLEGWRSRQRTRAGTPSAAVREIVMGVLKGDG